ncbi:MAG: hypothetical protein JXM69_02665 [Anaerolineae bacterium]|nr:hypothetical protein [Anaerolineae bacterium]
MLKQTVQLFVKALIIGVLVNLVLIYVTGMALPTDPTAPTPYETQPLKQTIVNPELNFPGQ